MNTSSHEDSRRKAEGMRGVTHGRTVAFATLAIAAWAVVVASQMSALGFAN